MTITCNCGVVLKIAGAYPRRSGTRPKHDGGKDGRIPAYGQYSSGRHVCHECGKVVIIPEAEDQEACG